MEAKLCLCLRLFIWGTLTVQGQIPNKFKKNILEVAARQIPAGECSFHPLLDDCLFLSFISLTESLDMAIQQTEILSF